jgi:hypothetical protein
VGGGARQPARADDDDEPAEWLGSTTAALERQSAKDASFGGRQSTKDAGGGGTRGGSGGGPTVFGMGFFRGASKGRGASGGAPGAALGTQQGAHAVPNHTSEQRGASPSASTTSSSWLSGLREVFGGGRSIKDSEVCL